MNNNSMTFQIGDAVEVWSISRNIWFVGSVEEVAPAGGNGSVAEGCVKVRFGKKLEKWVLPKDFGKVLRRHVPRVYMSDVAAPPPSVMRLARARYYTPSPSQTSLSPAWLSGTSSWGSQEVTLAQLAELWSEGLRRDPGYVKTEDQGVQMQQIVANLGVVFKCMGRQKTAKVTVDEWMHHSLLLIYPPGRSVKDAIGQALANSRSSVLPHLVSLWVEIDKSSDGRIICADLEDALKKAGGWSRDPQEEAKALTHDMDGDGLASVCYCDFAAKYLKLDFVEVCLSWYDLTGGWSKFISPLLLWHQEGGVWHTAMVAFGKEFYYSGRIFRGRPGATPFGMPTKIQRLGLTTRTAKDFEGHITSELDSQFTEVNYDVLEWNCNHFTDKAALYLLEQQIPEEIRLQPERAMNAPMARMFRPMLNQWLGRIEGDAAVADGIDAAAMPSATASTLDAMDRAKTVLGSDRVVLYMPPGQSKPLAAQVQKRYRDGSCDITWYERGESQPKEAGRVPASKLKYEGDAERPEEPPSCNVS